MNKFSPKKFQLRIRLSQIIQTWLPYLEEKNADDFLKRFHLKQEYVETEAPQIYKITCEECNTKLLAPAGAILCICDKCRHQNILKKTSHCQNCGTENEFPQNLDKMTTCKTCGTQLRVVQPIFG
jgi:hypothetical protein